MGEEIPLIYVKFRESWESGSDNETMLNAYRKYLNSFPYGKIRNQEPKIGGFILNVLANKISAERGLKSAGDSFTTESLAFMYFGEAIKYYIGANINFLIEKIGYIEAAKLFYSHKDFVRFVKNVAIEAINKNHRNISLQIIKMNHNIDSFLMAEWIIKYIPRDYYDGEITKIYLNNGSLKIHDSNQEKYFFRVRSCLPRRGKER